MQTAQTDKSDRAVDAQVFWFRYSRQILAALALAVALILAFAGYRLYRDQREASASALLSSAKSAADYQQVISRYDDTAAAASAYLLLADDQRKERKFADANTTLQNFAERFPQHELIATARMAMASNLESLGKRDEAFATYQQIATANAGSFNVPLALLAQVHILEAKNQLDDARRLCETIITQYRESYAALEAQRLLRTLKPLSPSAPSMSASPLQANPSATQPSPSLGSPPPKP